MMTVREFLALLFGDATEGVLEITYLAPEGVRAYPKLKVDWMPMPLAIPDAYGQTLVSRNNAGYGVYFGTTLRREAKPPVTRTNKTTGRDYVAYVRGLAKDAHVLTCLWADVDDPTPEAYERMVALDPSCIVFSGGGWHGYWILDKPHIIHEVTAPEIKWALKGLAQKCNGDRKVAELARIMRVPYTTNTKPSRSGAKAMVVYVDLVRYTYADIIMRYAKIGKPPEPPIHRQLAGRIAPVPKWVEDYLTSGAPEGERNMTLFKMGCSLKAVGMSEGEAESLLTPRALADGLPSGEIKTTIASAYRTAVSPILPRNDRYRARQMAADDHLIEMRKKQGGGA